MEQLVRITKPLCASMQQQQKLHEERKLQVQKQPEQIQNQQMKRQKKFEKLLTNQVA